MPSIFILQFEGLEKVDKIKVPQVINVKPSPSSTPSSPYSPTPSTPSVKPSPSTPSATPSETPVIVDNIDSISEDIDKQTKITKNSLSDMLMGIRQARRQTAFIGYASTELLTSFTSINKNLALFVSDFVFLSINKGISATNKALFIFIDSLKMISQIYNASKEANEQAKETINYINFLKNNLYNFSSSEKEYYKTTLFNIHKALGFSNLELPSNLSYINLYNYTKAILMSDIAFGEKETNNLIKSLTQIEAKKNYNTLYKSPILTTILSIKADDTPIKKYTQFLLKNKKNKEEIIEILIKTISNYLQNDSLVNQYNSWQSLTNVYSNVLGSTHILGNDYMIRTPESFISKIKSNFSQGKVTLDPTELIFDSEAKKQADSLFESFRQDEKTGKIINLTIDELLKKISNIGIKTNAWQTALNEMETKINNKKIKKYKPIDFEQYITFSELNQRNQLQFVVNFPNKSVNLYHHNDDYKRDKERVRHIFDNIFKQMKNEIQWH